MNWKAYAKYGKCMYKTISPFLQLIAASMNIADMVYSVNITYNNIGKMNCVDYKIGH